MRLIHIVSNTQRRFKTIETPSFKKSLNSYYIGVFKSILRGGITGAILGSALSGGNEKYAALAGLFGAILDVSQNSFRASKLLNLYKNDCVKYNQIKSVYRRLNLVK